MAEVLRKLVDSLTGSHSDSFTSPSVMLSTILVLILSTVALFLSSPISSLFLSWKLKIQGRNPVPPGSLGLPFLGETLSIFPDINSFIARRHAKYGPVFKTNISGQAVFLPAPACNKFLFTNEPKLVQLAYGFTFRTLLGKDSFTLKRGDAYRHARRYVFALLSPSALGQYLPRIEEKVRSHLAELWQPPVGANNEREQDDEFELAIYKPMDEITFSIIADLILSLDSHDPDTEELRRLFKVWVLGPSSSPVYVPGTRYYRSMKARAGILAILSRLLAKRRVELKEGKATPNQDFLSYYLTEPDNTGKLVSEAEIIDTLLVFLFAGHDTTANAMTITLRNIALHPEIYDRLREEHKSIAERKSHGERLTKEDLAAMKYTWCVIQETLRRNAVIRGGFRETMTDVDYDGFTIPKGWKMWWTSASHMDPKFFEDPEKFDPSRFEDHNSKRAILPHVYAPFGGGPRMCPGNDFAKMEMLIYMHCVISNYKFSLVYPDEPVYNGPFPKQKSGTLMRIRRA